jgi:hypothetical protein
VKHRHDELFFIFYLFAASVSLQRLRACHRTAAAAATQKAVTPSCHCLARCCWRLANSEKEAKKKKKKDGWMKGSTSNHPRAFFLKKNEMLITCSNLIAPLAVCQLRKPCRLLQLGVCARCFGGRNEMQIE